MTDSPTGTTGASPERDPSELLRSLRWTQELARRIVRDPSLAADLHQETWVRAFERFGDAVPGRAWLAGTLRSLAYRARRGRRRRRYHEARGAKPEGVPGTDELVQRSEAQRQVSAAVAEMPEEHRTVLLLHFQEGLSLSAIGRHLGCSKATAHERVQRALAALRRSLRSDPDRLQSCLLIALPIHAAPGALLASKLPGSASVPVPGIAPQAIATTSILGLPLKKLALAVAALAIVALSAATLTGSSDQRSTSAESAVDDEVLAEPRSTAAAEQATLATVDAGERRAASTMTPARPAALDADAYVLRARVVDRDGAAVRRPTLRASSRDLRLSSEGDDDGAVELRMSRDDMADTLGEHLYLQIEGGPYQTLWGARIDGNGLGTIAPPAAGVVQDFGEVVLSPAGAVEGRATLARGEPLVGARIDAEEPDAEDLDADDPDSFVSYAGEEPTVETDADGRFVVPHLRAGTVALSLRHHEILTDAPRTICEVRVEETVGPVLLSGVRAEFFTGRVVDTDGEPIVDAYVNATGNWSITDTVHSDAEGRFRVALRRGSPTPLRAFVYGWRQVRPDPEEPQVPGTFDVVLERALPLAGYSVRVVDAITGDLVRNVRVATLDEAGGRVDPLGGYVGDLPAAVVQPDDGIPIDLVPGVDRLVVGAGAYRTEVVPTDELSEGRTVLTVELGLPAGIHGRVLRGGRPVEGVRVFATAAGLHVAEPREVLRGSHVERLPEVDVDASAWTKHGGYSPEWLVGLDGDPPGYRFVSGAPKSARRTAADGTFQLDWLEELTIGIQVEAPGERRIVVGIHSVEGDTLDVGDIELDASASLTVRFESVRPWNADEYTAVVTPGGVFGGHHRRTFPLDANGAFEVPDVRPGDVYFTLERAEGAPERPRLEVLDDVPVFHARLADGEARRCSVSLDESCSARIELEVSIGGANPVGNSMLTLTPIDRPDRSFDFFTDVDGPTIAADVRALGPCHAEFSQSSQGSGYVRFSCPGPPIELVPGEVTRRSVDIPAGRIRAYVPAGGGSFDYGSFDLVLEAADRSVEVIGVACPPRADGESQHRSMTTAPVPAGTYRGVLRPYRWKYRDQRETVLATFEVEVPAEGTVELHLGA
ncbi:MAG: sigma-70 family RNA polymerase sigma factor [Planctomycetota bacterium]